MATTLPQYFLGKHITTATFRLQQVVSGVISNAPSTSDVSVLAVLDRIEEDVVVTTTELSALTSEYENHIPLEEDATYTFHAIMQAGNGTGENPLFSLYNNGVYDHVKIVLTRAGNTITVFGVMVAASEDITKAKSVASITVKLVDAYTDATTVLENPAYT